jgi:molybdopterin converting factor subunit 1
MKFQVKLFAVARQIVGSETAEVEVQDQATVADVRAALVEKHPELEPTMKHMLIAVESEYAAQQMRLRPEYELALIPPVSGG